MWSRENVELVQREFKEVFGGNPEVIVSAPGRLDFLNTHQDYKGLPVVAVGINLRTYVAARRVDSDYVVVGSANIREESEEYIDKFSIQNPVLLDKRKLFGNYIRAAISLLKSQGHRVKGVEIWIRSWVPIGSGLGSSGTLLVSVLAALNEILDLGLSPKDIAEYAYIAEHDVMGIPCGRLDQYAAAFGNIVYIETKPPYNVEVLPAIRGYFTVVDTGIRHSTADIHPVRQREIDEGLSKLLEVVPENIKALLGRRYWEPRWELLDLKLLEPYLKLLPEKPRNRILFTLKTHRSTMLAIKVIKGERISTDELAEALETPYEEVKDVMIKGDIGIIGKIMTYQHTLLSRLYDVSLPQIDTLVEKLISFGALGAKLSGAGLGGAVIALFERKDVAEEAVRKIVQLGYGARGWVVEVDRGVITHYKAG
ncbi:MAG: GHMP kinase [Desulfurococcaceae archaeon]|jgi:galactokinase|nr:GHMP kinase [Desulfurococcaceae archaeon]